MSVTPDKLITEHERRRITSVSRSKWFDLERKGLAPKRRTIPGTRRVVWLESEIRQYVAWVARGGGL